MKNGELTALQRQALAHVERARAKGLSLSAFARLQGVSAQQIYDALALLRRSERLSGASSAARQSFLAVKVATPTIADYHRSTTLMGSFALTIGPGQCHHTLMTPRPGRRASR